MSCGTCSKEYIAQTGGAFQKRISEHYRSFAKKKLESDYVKHLFQKNYCFASHFDVLNLEDKGSKLTVSESLEINNVKHCNILLTQTIYLC